MHLIRVQLERGGVVAGPGRVQACARAAERDQARGVVQLGGVVLAAQRDEHETRNTVTEEMPPGHGIGAGPMDVIIRGWWEQQHRAHWRAAVSANMMFRTPPPPPYYRDLLGLASVLIAEARYEFRHELAVIVAQMACEILVEQTVASRVKSLKPRQTFNLHAKETRKLYKSATADDIEQTHFWPQYGPHAIRRHEVVHRGRRVNQAEAQESLTVATQFVDHVEKVRQALP